MLIFSLLVASLIARVSYRLISLALLLFLAGGTAGAADPATLRVKVFPGAQNLAILAALDKGFFAKRDLKIELQFTVNSTELRDGLAAGAFDIAHSATDNAVAMVDPGGKDVIIVMGGDSSMNKFFVQPEIRSIADVRGKVLLVDAPNTAYALQAKKILLNNGLKAGDYGLDPIGGTALRLRGMAEKKGVAAIMNPPFSIIARQQGMKSLGRTVDLLGPYQATGAFVMRPWAAANGTVLERYLAAYVEALRWALQPANRSESVAMLAKSLKLEQAVAEQTYDLLIQPKFGLTPDAKFDLEGFKNVLALRAEIEGTWGGKPPSPDRFIDLSYYERALR